MDAERRRAARALASGLAAFLAPLASAQTPTVHTEVFDEAPHHVVVTASSAWPTSVARGYAPVRVEFVNHGDRREELDVELVGTVRWEERTALRDHVSLAPFASETREFTAPLLGGSLENLRIDVNGSVRAHAFSIGRVECEPALRHLLFVTDHPDPPAPSAAYLAGRPGELVRCTNRLRAKPKPTSSSPVAPLATVFVAPDRLPLDSACYTSVDAVVVDHDHAAPTPEQLDALLAWVRMGGRVAFLAEQHLQLAAAIPDVKPWNEPRFLVASGEGWFTLRVGAGRVLFVDRPDLLDRELGLFSSLLEDDDWAVPLRWARQASAWPKEARIPDVGAVPRRTAAISLLCFVFLIGPVNSFVLRRRLNRPLLSLATIPIVALLASLLVFGYGVLRQGLDVKAATTSVTLLDQRTHRATTAEARELFAGLVAGRGITPAAGTCVSPYPAWTSLDPRCGTSVVAPYDDPDVDRGAEYLIDGANGRVLTGSFLPPRAETRQCLLSDAAARQRLEVRRSGERVQVVNELGVAISSLLLRDAGGKLHRAERVAAGEEKSLAAIAEPGSGDRSVAGLVRAVTAAFPDSLGRLPPACYVAQVEHNPFADSTGLKVNEVRSAHYVVGVLDATLEERR